MSSQWLPLADYSMKYRISVSTLRRKIKAEDIQFRFDDGKYFILDEPVISTHPREHRPSQTSEDSVMGAAALSSFPKDSRNSARNTYPAGASYYAHVSLNGSSANNMGHNPGQRSSDSSRYENNFGSSSFAQNESSPAPTSSAVQEFSERIASVGKGEPILTAANKLLTELKKAYTLILQEKEEQILHLKEEVTDLKTLVRVLESDNARLKRNEMNQ